MTAPLAKHVDRSGETREFPDGTDAWVAFARTPSCQVQDVGNLITGTLHATSA